MSKNSRYPINHRLNIFQERRNTLEICAETILRVFRLSLRLRGVDSALLASFGAFVRCFGANQSIAVDANDSDLFAGSLSSWILHVLSTLPLLDERLRRDDTLRRSLFL